MSDNERLAEIRARVDAVPRGPWHVTVNDLIGGYDVATIDKPASQRNPRDDGSIEIMWGGAYAVAEYVANAPADLAYLLAENARLRERVAALAGQEPPGEAG